MRRRCRSSVSRMAARYTTTTAARPAPPDKTCTPPCSGRACKHVWTDHIACHMKLVLDTDVVRSGLQSAGGASRLLLCGVAEGASTPLVTVATLLEYEDVLLRPENMAATGLTETGERLRSWTGFSLRSERVLVRRRLRPSIRDPVGRDVRRGAGERRRDCDRNVQPARLPRSERPAGIAGKNCRSGCFHRVKP